MTRLTQTAATAALALALALPAAQPAHADQSQFTWLGCAGQPVSTTGDLAGYTPGAYLNEAWRGQVSGSILPCRTPVENDVFAIASYDNDGAATALATRYGNLRSYSAQVDVRLKTAAVCLIDNLKSRLDCIKISWLEQETGPAQPVNGGHLPVESPLVAAAPVVTMDGCTVQPGCPTCVDG